jgi:serine/threonine-protein kinase RsbW
MTVAANQIVFHLTLPSSPKYVGRVERFINKLKHRLHLDEIQTNKLMVSLTEAVNNAIIHGNKSDPTKKVTVICELLPGWLLLLVHDEGRGFRSRKVGNPLLKKNLLRENGRGIFLMKTLMDRVEFETKSTGMQVSLWLNLNK